MRTSGANRRGPEPRIKSQCCTDARDALLDALDDGRDRLTEADAHRRDAVALVPPLELSQQRLGHARAGRSERMAERDPAAVRVDVPAAIAQPGVP